MKNRNIVQIMMVGALVFGLPILSPQAWADDEAQLKDQVQALQNRVDQLESALANKQQIPVARTMPVYDQWEDPFTQMMLMREQMERNMRQVMPGTDVFNPRMDIKQTDKQYLITMDVPGMDKDKINVEVKEGMLIISGERKSETQDNNNQYYRQERSFGSFTQAIPLPDDAKADNIDAKYNNGVLTVTVARQKKDEKRSTGAKIKVN